MRISTVPQAVALTMASHCLIMHHLALMSSRSGTMMKSVGSVPVTDPDRMSYLCSGINDNNSSNSDNSSNNVAYGKV